MALFKSRYGQHMLALRGIGLVSFSNGTLQTDDPELIERLREVCEIEKRGNRAVVEVGGDYGAPPLTGSVTLHLDGFAETTIHMHGESVQDLAERIAALLVSQHQVKHPEPPAGAADLFPPSDPAQLPEVVGSAAPKKRGRPAKSAAFAQ